jgi:hypothetical protein
MTLPKLRPKRGKQPLLQEEQEDVGEVEEAEEEVLLEGEAVLEDREEEADLLLEEDSFLVICCSQTEQLSSHFFNKIFIFCVKTMSPCL